VSRIHWSAAATVGGKISSKNTLRRINYHYFSRRARGLCAYNKSVRIFVFALSILASTSCSGPAPEKAAPAAAVKPAGHEPPIDLATKFPLAGQIAIRVVSDHLLGKDFMPGGNLADYKTPAGEYQMFLLKMPDAQKAAFLLLDWKSAMAGAKYLASMGGYFGMDQGKPIYLFAKGPYLAGFVGLSEEKADPEARRFAAKL
jgi:hypothetical protein